uniref:Uncharacterized protein LOC100367534 n=1 Tax=Saccoglossus kowalevskii TaxID=10224 RepID=A0ABM0GUI9_SACKO|nr:PREDICTED: uncharacterized protein LOC100367534 [Saccoglossus kowalevskii]
MFVIKLMYILSLLSVVSSSELLPENHPDYLCNKCSVRYYATSIFNSECIEDVPCPEFMLNAEDSAQSEPVTGYLGEFYISLTGYQDSRKKLRNSVGVGAKRLNGMVRGEMGQRNSGEVAYCQLCNIEHRGDIWVIYTCEDKVNLLFT